SGGRPWPQHHVRGTESNARGAGRVPVEVAGVGGALPRRRARAAIRAVRNRGIGSFGRANHSKGLSMLRPFATLGFVAAATVPLAAQYSTGFETIVASPGGTAMAGQDAFFVPPVAGSVDGAAYTYAGNTLAIPVNPNGGANFWAGVSLGGTSL